MAIKGKKDDNINNENEQLDLDKMIMSAIEETDKEEAEAKAKARKAHEEQLALNRQKEEKARALEAKVMEQASSGRRYFLMVEESTVGEDELKIVGNIYGEIHKNDQIYIYRPGGAVVEAKVKEVKSLVEDKVADGVRDGKVELTVPMEFAKAQYTPAQIVPKFSVVSSVKPQADYDPQRPYENAALLGITLEYKNYKDTNDYMGAFVGTLANSKFVIPVNSSKEELEGDENGKKKLRFMMIKNPNDESKGFLPIFSDWSALRAWKEAYADGNKPAVIVVSFSDIVKITRDEAPDMILNPFGPVAIHLPRKLLEDLDTLKAKAIKQTIVKKQTINAKESSKILVVPPMPGEETNNIRDALRAYAMTVPNIASFGLLMMRQNKNISYLVIVDCPRSSMRDVFGGMRNAAKPYMNKVTSMNFSLYADAPFADDYFSNHTLDYVRIGNY